MAPHPLANSKDLVQLSAYCRNHCNSLTSCWDYSFMATTNFYNRNSLTEFENKSLKCYSKTRQRIASWRSSDISVPEVPNLQVYHRICFSPKSLHVQFKAIQHVMMIDGYICLDPENKHIIISRRITFWISCWSITSSNKWAYWS